MVVAQAIEKCMRDPLERQMARCCYQDGAAAFTDMEDTLQQVLGITLHKFEDHDNIRNTNDDASAQISGSPATLLPFRPPPPLPPPITETIKGFVVSAGLENDEYTRKTDGYLPTAEVAFIDEIFKANSAILNALLTLLNERLFDNGNQRLEVPLLCLVSFHSLQFMFPVDLLCMRSCCSSCLWLCLQT